MRHVMRFIEKYIYSRLVGAGQAKEYAKKWDKSIA